MCINKWHLGTLKQKHSHILGHLFIFGRQCNAVVFNQKQSNENISKQKKKTTIHFYTYTYEQFFKKKKKSS